uniref:hypothetical protein n=1 Tax=uncultured Erythrobacter sp. TaxID=263913 RepID=UPI002614A82A|nr:hypothetical protein [uncultured Erythrobacter sp.]
MTSRFPNALVNVACAALAVSLLAGCSIERPSTITHRAALKSPIVDVAFAPNADASGLRSEFSGSLDRAFGLNGVNSESNSRWIADFAVASFPTDVSVVPIGDEAAGVDPSKTTGINAKWYHKCQPVQVRGSLAIFDSQTNTLVAKSEGHFVSCPGDLGELDALADLLVRSAMNDTAVPKP